MNATSINLFEKLYNSIIIMEMDKKYVSMINDIGDDLPFDNIFGEDLRIIVPFSENAKYNDLKDELSKINGFTSFNPAKKEVIRKVKFKRPDGVEGEKDQIIGIGKAINLLKIPEEKKKDLLNWFSHYSSNMSELDDLSHYTIILSRHPTDVLRMSDISDIKSCHSEGGMYFHCAIQEAKTGGPIAYLIHTNDLERISDPIIFQKGEIFQDRDRDIKGILASSRIRIRRYKDTEGHEYAIPETRVYGEHIAGFLDAVTKFLRDKQSNLIENKANVVDLFTKRKIVKKGGSYSDSSDSTLFNNFFGSQAFFGTLKHASADINEEGTESFDRRVDQFDDELSAFEERYANGLKHSAISYDINVVDEEYVYYSAYGNLNVDLSPIDLASIDLPDMSDESDFVYYLDYATSSPRQPWKNKDISVEQKNHFHKVSKFLQYFLKFSEIDRSQIYAIEDTYNKPNSLSIRWSFGDDNNAISENTDDYYELCQTVKHYDNKYDDIHMALIKALYSSRLLKTPETKTSENNINYEKFQNDELELNHFGYDEDGFEGSTVVNTNLNDEQLQFVRSKMNEMYEPIASKIESIFNDYIAQKKPEYSQMGFKTFAENVQHIALGQNVKIDITIRDNAQDVFSGKYPQLSITFTPEVVTPDFVDFMIYFDQIFEDFGNSYLKGLLLHFIPDELLDDVQKRDKYFLAKNRK